MTSRDLPWQSTSPTQSPTRWAGDREALSASRFGISSPRRERGVFETMLLWNGRPLELEAHIARLESSVQSIYGSPAPHGIRELILEAARRVGLGRLRATVAAKSTGELSVDLRVQPVDDTAICPPWEAATSLVSYRVARPLGATKWADRRLLEEIESASAPALPLLLDADETVLEASRANAFTVRAGTIVTPPLDGRILPGVTRARVIALAVEVGVRCVERDFTLVDLLEADEVFLTGSIRGVEPVSRMDDRRVWNRGDVTPLLAGLIRQRWEREAKQDAAGVAGRAHSESTV